MFEKIDIIKKLEGKSYTVTIVTIARQKEQILQRSDDSKKSLKIRKTFKKGTNDQMDKEYFMHFLKRRKSNLPVFCYMLQDYGR
ncbi:hypothetical protein A3Q56_08209 [Intoshia linei]|uniref:Uncharacterized protein n=1 Tax=Intoshia linei TaxID=1819745 RepID=A0A177APZ9_9BILA|nr:hypothetical protein A3Q56_08209 [Intoshia linei]